MQRLTSSREGRLHKKKKETEKEKENQETQNATVGSLSALCLTSRSHGDSSAFMQPLNGERKRNDIVSTLGFTPLKNWATQ